MLRMGEIRGLCVEGGKTGIQIFFFTSSSLRKESVKFAKIIQWE